MAQVNFGQSRQAVIGMKITAEQLADAVKEFRKSNKVKQGVSDTEVSKFLSDVYGATQTAAKNLTDEEWSAYVNHNQKPEVVALSPKQLEGIRGGYMLLVRDPSSPFPGIPGLPGWPQTTDPFLW